MRFFYSDVHKIENRKIAQDSTTITMAVKRPSILKSEGSSGPMKKVGFDQLQVREYPIILGDNPATSDGNPVTIDWNHQKEIFVDVEYFELYRRQRRSSKDALKLDSVKRVKLAVGGGSSLKEVGKTCVEISKIQKQRAKSAVKTNWETFLDGTIKKQERRESFTRIPNEVPSMLNCWKNGGGLTPIAI